MDRLAELAEYDRSIPGLIDDDFLAAGFTPDEIASYRGTFTPPSLTPQDMAQAEQTYGTLQAPDYTMRETSTQRVQDALINQVGLDPYLAGRYARDIMGDTSPTSQNILDGLGLADLTPLGAVFGVEEGAGNAVEGYEQGDPLKMGLGVAEAGLGVAEAFPLTRPIAEGAGVLAREVYSSPYMADAIGTLRGIRDLDADFLLGRGDPAMAQGVGADVVGGAPQRVYRIDNPGGNWVAGKQRNAEKTMAQEAGQNNAFEKGLTGSTTAYTTEKINLPVSQLRTLKGASGEMPAAGQPKFDELMKSVQEEGFQTDRPILIGVNHLGDPYIMEGNNRVAVAAATNVDSIPVEVQWYNGGEDAATNWTPQSVQEMSQGVGADVVGGAPMNLSEEIEAKYPNVTVDLLGNPERGYELSRIIVPEGERGTGVGTQVMEDMIQKADEQGARISLTPDTSFGGSSTSRLKDFYKRFGFVENKGKNKDFSTRNTMYRDPQEPKAAPNTVEDVSVVEPKQIEVPTDERRGIIAFHGSGADFDRFELSKIGTGERAQAFGRGLYFTDSEDIAEFYRQSVRQRQDMSLGREVSYRGNKVADLGDTAAGDVQSLENSAVNRIAENINKVTTMATKDLPQSELAQIAKDKSVSDLQKQLDGLGQVEDDPIMEMVAESLQDEIDALEAVDVSEFEMATGKKYQVNIDVSPEELLNWDLPLDQQTPAAQRAILKTVDEIDLDDAIDLGFDIFYGPYDGDEAGAINAAKDKLLNDFSAKNFLQSLSKIRGKGAGEELLAKNGLKGITYKAEQGPTARDPSSGGPNNYVIFDDKLINIMKKYGIVGPVAVTGIAAQEETSNEI